MTKYLRILHYLSPVRWDSNLFRADIDSNFKVVLKTIEFLPECHHYILMPQKHNFVTNAKNITLIPYDYPHSGVSSKTHFNYNNIRIDVTQLDIDLVFNHQLELAPAIANYFHAKRQYSNLKIFSFCHWLDIKENRIGGDKFNPIFFLSQLSGFYSSDKVFFHNKQVFDKYFLGELKERNLYFGDTSLAEKKLSFMPLSSTIDKIEAEPFDLKTNKKIIVFNHRYSDSSNTKMLNEFYERLDKDTYELWVTDTTAPAPYARESLNIHKYKYLLENCYCSVCFINKYSTWNLALQDSIKVNKPTFVLNHNILNTLLPKDYKYFFSSLDELFSKLGSVSDEKLEIEDFDLSFRENIITCADAATQKVSTTQEEKIDLYKKLISEGIRSKIELNNTINPNLARSNGFSSIRSVLLNEGYKDDFNETRTTYYTPSEIVGEKKENRFFEKDINIFNF